MYKGKTKSENQGRGIGYTMPWLILLFVCLILATSCSTEKAKWTNIRYHNTTCHYNVWWNGNESLKLGREKLFKSVVDDYTLLLPPEPVGTAANATAINPDMDRAVEKGIKGIMKHSIYVGGIEHVDYIRECYLLTAYATFYKQDYIATTNTCNILIDRFSGTTAGDEGAVLLARCMTRDGRYVEAENTLDQLVLNLSRGNFSRNRRDKLYLAMVEATIPQQKYKKAVEYIHLAIDASSDRRQKARLTFIMAQIYQELDKRPVAAKYYHKVLSYSPEYVMEFNAKLGEASCADIAHSDVTKLEKQLDELLNDKKNAEYLDQIYYAKGEMYMGMKDAIKACENFKKSVAVSNNNKAQKAKSSIRLGEVLYELFEDYSQAQLYYDTAVQNITPSHPQYESVRLRSDLLTELVSYTSVYQRCDSLLAVAALPEAERMALINQRIERLKQQEAEARERALLAELAADDKVQKNTLTGDWYFYNASTVQKGKEAFRKQWGMRILDDFWCLSNRSMLGVSMSNFTTDDAPEDSLSVADKVDTLVSLTDSTLANANDPHNPAYYLRDLPTSHRQLDSIDSITAINLVNAGYLFYDGIHNTPKALECYLRMANDYTAFPSVVQAFYMLYRIYERQGNTPQSNYYRDMVLKGFPDSDFANLIRDNEFYLELMRRDRQVDADYENVYTLFNNRRYSQVVGAVAEADELYANNPALNRFHYWKALADYHRGNKTEAISQLEDIVSTTADADTLHSIAENTLDLIRSDSSLFADNASSETITEADEEKLRVRARREHPRSIAKDDADTDTLPSEALIFRYRENQQHYVIVIVNDKNVRATELQYRLSDFNTQYYSNSGYKVNAFLFTDSTQLLTIHRFQSADDAMRYYNHLKQPESPLSSLAPSDHTEFAISTQNYASFYNRKNIDAYMAFFKKYYMNEKK